MKSIIGNLKYGIDFTYSYPRGRTKEPQIQVINGNYQGLIIDLWHSGIASLHKKKKIDHKLIYKYSIVQIWNSIPKEQIIDKKIILTENEQNFLTKLICVFIMETNHKGIK
jgi:hypothetical protein